VNKWLILVNKFWSQNEKLETMIAEPTEKLLKQLSGLRYGSGHPAEAGC
jgi:hypothetical protein